MPPAESPHPENDLAAGEPREDAEELVPALYSELRKLAAACLRGERRGHTLEPTALVHEAYLRLHEEGAPSWRDRPHFCAWAARVMRRVLVEHARKRKAVKRGRGRRAVPLDEVEVALEETSMRIEALDEALERLGAIDARKLRVVELHFFGGLDFPEIAALLEVSLTTVERDWKFAKAWLRRDVQA